MVHVFVFSLTMYINALMFVLIHLHVVVLNGKLAIDKYFFFKHAPNVNKYFCQIIDSII